jgi:hypothetical protein
VLQIALVDTCLMQAVLEVVDCVLDSDAAYLDRLADLYTELAHAKNYSALGYASNFTVQCQSHLRIVNCSNI